MQFLRKTLDSVEPMFKPGGKLERLYPLYEAGDTFLFTPGEVAHDQTHVRDGIDLKRMMSLVVVALGPAILFGLWNTGYQANTALAAMVENGTLEKAAQPGYYGMLLDATVGYDPSDPLACIVHGAIWFLPLYIVTLIVGGNAEAIFAVVRKHEINEGFLVTSMLYPLTLPPTCPLWIAGLGILFGVVLAKEVFGGTGKNFLNIALTSRAFLYFAYPGEMIGDKVWNAGTAALRQPDGSFADGYSAATMLTWTGTAEPAASAAETMAAATEVTGVSFMSAAIGTIEGSIGSTSAVAAALGAAILIATGVGSWRIMAGCVVGLLAFTGVLWGIGSDTNAVFAIPPWWHLVIGGFAFGAVFMATDPVSAAMTNTGRWWYGILIGVMTALIRVVNPAFPEGIGLAILFGNVFAPLIDYFVIEANVALRQAYRAKAGGAAATA